jgi:hypothetical protein
VVTPPIAAPLPPAVGSAPPPAVTLPSAPSPVQAPQVESYDEQAYKCQPGDTLRSISNRFYHNEKYERALLLFNRAHPMATEAIRHDPPELTPGTVVFIPQIGVLEKRYAAAIPGLVPLAPVTQTAPAPAPVPPAPSSSIPSAVPPAAVPAPAQPPSPTPSIQPPASPPTSPATQPPATTAAPSAVQPAETNPTPPAATLRAYKVRGNGETFREIAQRTLGNPERWAEIYQLNRSFNPASPLPAGAPLWLPSDAHVEPADMP